MALTYDLSVSGVRSVKTALRSIEAEMLRHNQRINRSLGMPGRRRVSPEAEAARVKGATERADAKAAAKRQAQIAKEEQAKIRSAERVATQQERLQSQLARRQLARFKRETIEKSRAEEREVRRRAAAEQALARRRLARFKAETLRNNRLTAASRQAMLGGAYRGAAAPLAAVGRAAKMAVGLAGSYVVGASVAKQFATERSAAALANKAFGTPGETRSREQIKQSLMAQSEAIGAQTGNREGVIQAIDKFVAISGNLPAAQEMAQFMADISDATGADMQDVGRTGGQVMQALMARGVEQPEAIKQTSEILSTMAAQAKIGSIEFADLATQMGKVISSTARFGGKVSDLTATMSAMAQLAIAGGASSPEEATTAILRFSDDLVQNAGRYDKMIQRAKASGEIKGEAPTFFTDKSKTQLRGPEEIMFDIFRTTKGDLTQVKKLFGIRSMKALEPFQQTFAVFQRAGDQMGGIEAVQQQLNRFREQRMTPEEVRTSAAFAREQPGRKFQIVWEDLQMKVGKELAPAVEELIPSFVELSKVLKNIAPYLSAFLKALAKNPLLIGGSLLAGRMGLGAIGGGIGGMMSTPGMAAGGLLGGGGGATGGILNSISGGTPVRVTNFPAGIAGLNGQVVGQSIGGVLVAAGIGAAIGAPIAAAITVWGRTEIEKSEAKTSAILKEATLGDAKKAKREASSALKSVQTQRKLKEERAEAVKIGMGVGGGMLPASIVAMPELDPKAEQRKFDERNLQNAKNIAEQRLNMQDFDKFIAQTRDAVPALAGFYKKLDEFSPPKPGGSRETPNRGNAPSPVKP